MPILHAIVLGIVQGLTEFLPISSSGHLAVVPWLFGWNELTDNPELSQTFDVALHIGTFVGALGYFWRDIWSIITTRARHRLGLLLVLSTIPAGIVGLVLEESLAEIDEALIGAMLIVFGLVLAWADRRVATRAAEMGDNPFGVRDAALMGLAQASALMPGVSRSGVTMSAGRLLGFDRESAARLSFLMAMPVIAGAGALKGAKVLADGGLGPGLAAPFLWGMLASALTGAAAVWFLLRLVKTRTFTPFVVYRVVAGLAIIAIALAR
ncbi:MAG: undecaprenyl-diphosphate phosphatase [Acidimicrobiales bacterium]|nr:undecaprenyl-diphosphate phosphatase [Acidimicrobiales bacterium]